MISNRECDFITKLHLQEKDVVNEYSKALASLCSGLQENQTTILDRAMYKNLPPKIFQAGLLTRMSLTKGINNFVRVTLEPINNIDNKR